MIEAWRSCPSRVTKYGFVFSAGSLGLGLLNAAATIYLVAWLFLIPGYKGSTAGFILIYPPLAWLFLQLPGGLLAYFFCLSQDVSLAPSTLRRLSKRMIAIDLIVSFLIIGSVYVFLIIRASL